MSLIKAHLGFPGCPPPGTAQQLQGLAPPLGFSCRGCQVLQFDCQLLLPLISSLLSLPIPALSPPNSQLQILLPKFCRALPESL